MKFNRTKYLALILPLMLAFSLICPAAAAKQQKAFVVVIDAGHGGKDVGAAENGAREKDINLAVALKLGDLIKKKLKNTRVIFTRDDDTFISLQKRADIANKAKADLFISIHTNSVDKSNKNRQNVTGASTYVLGRHRDADNLAVARRENAVVELDADDSAHFSEFDPNSDESYIIFEMTQKKNLQNSVRFAADVQKEMAAAGRYSRGVHQAGFWVLWSTSMPAVLVELDFICNPEQAQFLTNKEGQDKLARAIFNAVEKYEDYFRKSLGSVTPSDEPTADNQLADNASATTESTEDTESVVLPEATETVALQHRSVSTTPRTSSSGKHRRRPGAARTESAVAEIEETTIAMTSEEDAPQVTTQSQSPSTPQQPQASSQQKKETQKKKETGPARRDRNSDSKRKALKQKVNVVYMVLLFTSPDQLPAGDIAFQGLSPVGSFRENNTYKYTYGESKDRHEMESLLAEISHIFPDARVIRCYQN